MISNNSRQPGIDSAEAYCERCAYPTEWCRRTYLAHILEDRDVQARLPYLNVLFWMSGASSGKWPAKEGAPKIDDTMV